MARWICAQDQVKLAKNVKTRPRYDDTPKEP